MVNLNKISVTLFCSLLPMLSYGVIYETALPNGTISYSDIYTANSQIVNLAGSNVNNYNPTNAAPATAATTATSSSETTNPATANSSSSIKYLVVITSPSNDSTFQNQDIQVVANTTPALQGNDQAQLLIDAKPFQQPQKSLYFTIPSSVPLARGPHILQVRIVKTDASGTQAGAEVSQSVQIYKQQPSLYVTANNDSNGLNSQVLQPVAPAINTMKPAINKLTPAQ